MADPRDLKGSHAREFTNHELLTLRIWFDLDQAGNDDLAQRLLDAGLMLEHYTSLLDNDPGKRSFEEIQNQAQLNFAFFEVLNEANAFLLSHRTATRTIRITDSNGIRWVSSDNGDTWTREGGQ